MKLHLPRLLAAAVLASLVAVPAYTAEIPDEYKDNTVLVWDADYLADYSSNASTDYIAFLLGMDIEVPSDISMEGGNLYFTSRNAQLPVSLDFIGSDSFALTNQSSLVFDTLSGLSFTNYKGGAIHTSGNMVIRNVTDGVEDSDNPDVLFTGNSASSSYGGAIHAGGGVSITGNGDVTFSGNTASAYSSFGGAIYASEEVSITGNGDVTFTGNTASSSSPSYYAYSSGGAIHAGGGVSITGNADVSFSGHHADESGAAIAASGVSISGNKDVSFTGNYTENGYHGGGAIRGQQDVTINGNETVNFTGNSACVGGAIYAPGGDVSISGNGDVTFTGNFTSSYYSYSFSYYGGAIYALNGGVSITGNETVCFEKNYERENSTYRLRSIYAGGKLNLSAKTGGQISFYDSVRGGTTALNADYTDADGITQQAKGTIIFSGQYTKTHLDAILEANNEGRVATDSEILNSRTTTLGVTTLYGGTLQVVDGAILDTASLSVAAGSSASVLLRDAGLNGTISFGTDTSLELQGANTTTGSLTLGNAVTLTVTLDNSHLETAALTLTGSVSTGTLSLNLNVDEERAAGMYRILSAGSLATEAAWTAENVSVQGGGAAAEATFDDLLWLNGTLYYYAYGTGLKVDNNTHLVLEGSSNSVAAAVEVAAGSTLVMKSSGYVARSSMVNGTLAFADTDAFTETLSGSGSVQATDSQVTVGKISGFTGNLQVEGKGAGLSIAEGSYTGAGTLNVAGGTLTFGAKGNITLNAGGRLELQSWDDAVAGVTANNITVSAGATLAAKAGVAALGDMPEISNHGLSVDLSCTRLTLEAGATLDAEGACFDLNNGMLTLAVTPDASEKIELVLAGNAVYTGSEQVVLFLNVGKAVFTYGEAGTTSGSLKMLDAADYFTGAGINEATQLVYDQGSGTVYLQGVVTIPEPTTATLSLLALAGLCARRRR